MNRQAIHIGMIGAGGIAKSHHLPNLKEIPGVHLTAVANRHLASAQKAAEQFGFTKVYDQWQKVVDDPEVDVVFICTPPFMHKEMTLYALSKGKHVFCQARMALDLKEAQEMLEADQRTELTTMLCPPPHYMQVEPYLISLLEQKLIGEVRNVVLSHPTSMYLDPSQPLHWRQRRDLQGINVLDVGIMGEVLQKWFGPLQTIAAIGNVWTPERPFDKEGKTAVELPDAVSISGQFVSGAMLTALFSGAVSGGQSRMDIHGTKGTLTCFPQKSFLTLHDHNGETHLTIPNEHIGGWTVESDFIHAVRCSQKGMPSFVEGVQYMAFTQAVIDSVQTGQRVSVVRFTENEQ